MIFAFGRVPVALAKSPGYQRKRLIDLNFKWSLILRPKRGLKIFDLALSNISAPQGAGPVSSLRRHVKRDAKRCSEANHLVGFGWSCWRRFCVWIFSIPEIDLADRQH